MDNQIKITAEQVDEIVRAFAEGATLRETRGIDDAQLEAVYASGVEFYRAGNYADAEKIFRFLVTFEHTSSRFWTAFGSLRQAQKRYAEAIKCYQVAAFFDLHNPRPVYYAAECFKATGDLEFARQALATLEQYAPKETEVGKKFLAKGAALKATLAAK